MMMIYASKMMCTYYMKLVLPVIHLNYPFKLLLTLKKQLLLSRSIACFVHKSTCTKFIATFQECITSNLGRMFTIDSLKVARPDPWAPGVYKHGQTYKLHEPMACLLTPMFGESETPGKNLATQFVFKHLVITH